MLTQAELTARLNYNQETGIFTWISTKCHTVKVGDIAGSSDKDGYLTINVLYKHYKAHRLAWLYVYGVMPSGNIDHKNGNVKDNRIENLRECTDAQNSQNRKTPPKHSKSGYLGVTYHKKQKKYVSRINLDGKRYSLGAFSTAIEASEAYLSAKRIMHPFSTI